MEFKVDEFLRSLEQQEVIRQEYLAFLADSLKKGKRITQSDTARAIRMDRSTLSKWVNGKQALSVRLLLLVAAYVEAERSNEKK